MLFVFVLYYWWLKNYGESFNGLANEDINWTGPITNVYTGKNIVINVMADGARPTHISISNRSINDEFRNIFDDSTISEVINPEKNLIGQSSLMIAAGKPGTCNSTGIAVDSRVGSYYFYNSTDYKEDLMYVVCHRSEKWHIGLLSYQETNCQNRFCRYIEPSILDYSLANDCLYSPTNDSWAHPIIVPAGSGNVSDILFSPPGRWPLVFSISGINNRGLPLNHGAEGTGIFMG